MEFAVSTHWNAYRHAHGEKLIDDILELGVRQVELGYDTRLDLVPGIRKRHAERAVDIVSLHAYCPVPMGAPRGHPELFTLASLDRHEREQALAYLRRTIEFAAELGAKVVVNHAGNVKMTHYSRDLMDLAYRGEQFTERYERLKFKLIEKRERPARKQMAYLLEGLHALLPDLEAAGITLGLEILPTWEAMPSEIEFEEIFRAIPSPRIGFWLDIGHAQIRENLGFINMTRWLERLAPRLAGMHVHDVAAPAQDHVMPPHGMVQFDRFLSLASLDLPRVIEPSPKTPARAIIEAIDLLKNCWSTTAPHDEQGNPP
ncbi:MAG TPA: sugar phosphate isomerase/epimerase family protein [Kiritimatiellia bacterium]|nr:sugar phosphate isomerase/epimerase family protein [Kiritimatiellia bacterium]